LIEKIQFRKSKFAIPSLPKQSPFEKNQKMKKERESERERNQTKKIADPSN
jgi:hypothetical protein